MCINDPVVGMFFNCLCTVMPLIVFYVCSWFFAWNGASNCNLLNISSCGGDASAWQTLYQLSVASVGLLVGVPFTGALYIAFFKKNRTLPREFGAIIPYIGAAGTAIAGLYFMFSALELGLPTIDATDQGQLFFFLAAIAVPVCGCGTLVCIWWRTRSARGKKMSENVRHTVQRSMTRRGLAYHHKGGNFISTPPTQSNNKPPTQHSPSDIEMQETQNPPSNLQHPQQHDIADHVAINVAPTQEVQNEASSTYEPEPMYAPPSYPGN